MMLEVLRDRGLGCLPAWRNSPEDKGTDVLAFCFDCFTCPGPILSLQDPDEMSLCICECFSAWLQIRIGWGKDKIKTNPSKLGSALLHVSQNPGSFVLRHLYVLQAPR